MQLSGWFSNFDCLLSWLVGRESHSTKNNPGWSMHSTLHSAEPNRGLGNPRAQYRGERRGNLHYAAVCSDSTKFFVHNRETGDREEVSLRCFWWRLTVLATRAGQTRTFSRLRTSDANAFWWRDGLRRDNGEKDASAKDATCHRCEFSRILKYKASGKEFKISPLYSPIPLSPTNHHTHPISPFRAGPNRPKFHWI